MDWFRKLLKLEIDSPSLHEDHRPFSPQDHIIQNLVAHGVPKEHLWELQSGLVGFVKSNKTIIPDLVRVILPSKEEIDKVILESIVPDKDWRIIPPNYKKWFGECMLWLQWLMFEGEPSTYLEKIAGQRGVCGAVFGKDDLGFRCRTCQLDPTCAICVPCFHSGNHEHEHHDYSMIYTAGGCCDCGDETALKRDGFCSMHRGLDNIPPLPEDIVCSVGPVLDAIFEYCIEILEPFMELRRNHGMRTSIAAELTFAVAEMLLNFCNQSESLLIFISRRLSGYPILLDILVRSARFLDDAGDYVERVHELFMKLLKDPVFKSEFGKAFVRDYPGLIREINWGSRNHVQRKYELFSVQIFSDPTVTLRLLKEVDLLAVLLKCLGDILVSCSGEAYSREDGKLQIDKWEVLFEVASHVIRDIKYVMNLPQAPQYAVNEQQNIVRAWFKILSHLHTVKPPKRETDRHVEREDTRFFMFILFFRHVTTINALMVSGAFTGMDICEEESSASQVSEMKSDTGLLVPSSVSWLALECLRALDCWLGSVISCASDVPAAIGDDYPSTEKDAFSLLRSPKWPSIYYDVSGQAAAVFIPLHKFLSVLLKEAIGKFDVCVTSYTTGARYANNEFFQQVLKGCHPYGFSSFVMEHPLQIRVFCAQVQAGMWRRNGKEAILFHHWSESMLELDLFLLQFCAASSPADLYVGKILERFGLLQYLSLDLDLSSEYEPVLVQQMLSLVIQIVKERRFCGFTVRENLERELVCALASGDATHSELVESLPDDLSEADQLQEILDAISQYSDQSGQDKGKYSLRPEYWKSLDLYHLQRDTRKLRVAEDRYMRFCGVSALTKLLPKWTKIYQPLCGIARIATCRRVLHIIRAVLYYSVSAEKSVQSRAPDAVLVAALHLLSLGLDICSVHKESGHQFFHDENSIPLLAFAGEEIQVELHNESSKQSLLSLLVLVMRKHKKCGQGNGESGNLYLSSLVESLLKLLAELDFGCMNKLRRVAPEIVGHVFQSLEIEHSASSDSDAEKRKARARETQAAVLANMRAQQSKFLEDMNNSADSDLDGSCSSHNAAQDICFLCHDADSKDPISFLILLQKSKLVNFVERGPLTWDQDWKKFTSKVSGEGNRMTDPSGSNVSPMQNGGLHTSGITSAALPYDGFSLSGCDGIHISSCGHAVHHECLDRYFSSRRYARGGEDIVDLDQGEFLCPVCRRISNSILPDVPGDSQNLWTVPAFPKGDPLDSSRPTAIAGTNSFQLQHALSLLGTAVSVVLKDDILEVLPMQQNRRIGANLQPLFRVLCGMCFPGKQDILCKSGRTSPSLILWDVLKYTIVSTEIASRCGKGTTALNNCHSSLYNELKSSGGFVLPILLGIVQQTRSDNVLDVLLRFKGIQLFANSVLPGSNPSESSSGTYGEGNILRLLKHIDGDMVFLGTHFWNQAADPVLMQDPFSTLMWILFCLPYPVLSCKQSLLSLVHIFYAVSVVQAVIVYFGRSESRIEELNFNNSLLIDVLKLVRESGTLCQFFVTNYPYLSDLKDAVKSMCLPYLRRCDLLWEILLLSNSASSPIRGHNSNGTSDVADKMGICSSGMDFNEFSQLESMFGIPSMDAVLEDTLLRSLVLNWCNDLQRKFIHCNMQRVLHLTPCVPFQLIQLPPLYQDLLERYVKPICPLCGNVKWECALCLLCGRLCSPSWDHCCRESDCRTHAMSCGAGIGVFLFIKRTIILLVHNVREKEWPSLYLDAFGEEDIQIMRGKALFLNEERYAALNYMVASHGIHRLSWVYNSPFDETEGRLIIYA